MEKLTIQQTRPLPNKLELIFGLATGVFAILAPLLLSIKTPTSLTGFLPYIFIAALGSAGAYLHRYSVEKKARRRVSRGGSCDRD